jgi:hypothetical protein
MTDGLLNLWWGRRDSNSHGLPHMHLKHARIPFRHVPTNYISLSKRYFFSGAAEGEAFGSSFAGLAASEAAGNPDAAGEAAGEVATAGTDAMGEGVGVGVSTGSPTTERPPVTPGNEKINASSINKIAATIVAFSSGFCAPRGPKAV